MALHLYVRLYIYYKHFQDRYRSVVYCPTHFFWQYTVVSCVSFEGQDTPSPLYGEERPNQLRGALQVENRVQVENRFPSVKIFITIHQPKSFLSP